MCSYDPLHKNKRLWNETENILSESIAGTLMLHQNLAYLDSCKAVVRQDLDKLSGKVRLIGGGVVVDGVNYAGFVGPGMLTAAVLGLQNNASAIPTSDSIVECINHIFQNGQQKSDGVLMLVHDCSEYYLNFLEAKHKAESKGIPTKVIYVKDEMNDKLSQKTLSSPRSPSGLLLVYKIAGAMSEDGNTLDEIYEACNDIIKNKVIFSTGVYISEYFCDDAATIQISRGDVLSDRSAKRFSMENSSTSKIVDYLIHDIINKDNSLNFPQGSKLAILIDYFGGFCELEANIVINELVNQLSTFKFKVRIIYTGAFHVTLDLKGFHLSVLNLSNNLRFLYYLSVPTLAYSWPKTNSREILLRMFTMNTNSAKKKTADVKTEQNNDSKANREITKHVKIVRETDVLLTAIEFACEAVIACNKQIDMLDNPEIPQAIGKCGSRLAYVAESIKSAIHKNKFVNLNVSGIIFRAAYEFEQNIQDPQSELYRFFLNALGKEVENKVNLDASDWLNAFVRVINLIEAVAKGTKFSDTFNAAKSAFCNAFAEDDNVIHALGQAVNAAQKQTAHLILESGKIPEHLINKKDIGFVGLAGSHAIGVWMRGAYEGIKLKYSNREFREKRKRSNDYVPGGEIMSKALKFS